MFRRLSINIKIMGIFCISLILLMLLMSFTNYRSVKQQKALRSDTSRFGNTIALNSILKNRDKALEKVIMNMLNNDELLEYAQDPGNANAKMVLEGMFISLEEENNCSRFIVYDADLKTILQKNSEGLPARPQKLPGYLHTLFKNTAKDFSTVYYFRGNEASGNPFPVEYCGATVITDDDDNPVGYVEMAMPPSTWLNGVSELTLRQGGVYNIANQQFSYSVDKALYAKIAQSLGGRAVTDGARIHRIDKRYFHSEIMPVKDPSGKIVSQIWLTQENTDQVVAERKNLLVGIGTFVVLCFLSIMATIFIVRKNVVKPINRTIEGLTRSTDQMQGVTGQLSLSSQSLAEGSSEQAASIEETSSSLEEMSAMTMQNADHAKEADTLMQASNQVVQRANDSMSELTTAMDQIFKASEETSKIIKTIDEIAFQTNLLALNAAVEAARAGDAGAGFAVVADEVRNLAIRSADAAKQTATLIEDTVNKANEGTELVTKTNDAFAEVSTSTAKVGDLVSEIAAASNEQSEGIGQINKAVTEMDKVIQQNAAGAEESASATEELKAQSEQMKAFVDLLVSVVKGEKQGARHSNKTELESDLKREPQVPQLPHVVEAHPAHKEVFKMDT